MSQLAGYIFGCNHATKNEVMSRELFGLPAVHSDLVHHIYPGMALFLFNYSTRELHGVFEAASHGGMHLDRDAFGGRFPAQVWFLQRHETVTLHESEFKPLIADNYFSAKHFRYELDKQQVNSLLDEFEWRMETEDPQYANGGRWQEESISEDLRDSLTRKRKKQRQPDSEERIARKVHLSEEAGASTEQWRSDGPDAREHLQEMRARRVVRTSNTEEDGATLANQPLQNAKAPTVTRVVTTVSQAKSSSGPSPSNLKAGTSRVVTLEPGKAAAGPSSSKLKTPTRLVKLGSLAAAGKEIQAGLGSGAGGKDQAVATQLADFEAAPPLQPGKLPQLQIKINLTQPASTEESPVRCVSLKPRAAEVTGGAVHAELSKSSGTPEAEKERDADDAETEAKERAGAEEAVSANEAAVSFLLQNEAILDLGAGRSDAAEDSAEAPSGVLFVAVEEEGTGEEAPKPASHTSKALTLAVLTPNSMNSMLAGGILPSLPGMLPLTPVPDATSPKPPVSPDSKRDEMRATATVATNAATSAVTNRERAENGANANMCYREMMLSDTMPTVQQHIDRVKASPAEDRDKAKRDLLHKYHPSRPTNHPENPAFQWLYSEICKNINEQLQSTC
ncbi:hypothetical protein CYMTET_32918 [Cymbomonas tetramitiformis]|uniref:DCD domain-containing protein n=1 Tax=Cymbomonas tetramitiformis TaxID=36881 RepID=A0AAE0KRG0_9CHLO|nr:hypothetical protein CYMTET_32918 [Cymbomonas tetramitiformis]